MSKKKILGLVAVAAVIGFIGSVVIAGKIQDNQVEALNKSDLGFYSTELAEETDLVNYEVYYHFVRPYKNYGNVRVKELMEKGMSSEEACSRAITEMIDIQVEHAKKWQLEWSKDTNENGIYDLVENGDRTDKYMEYLDYISNSPSALTFENDLSENEQKIINRIQGKTA